MKVKIESAIVIGVLGILLLFSGCKKNLDKIKPLTWTPDLAVPIVKDEITFEDALKVSGTEKNFFIDESGDISMLYYFHDLAFRITPKDLLTIPSVSDQYDHTITSSEQQTISTQGLDLPPVDYSINLTQDLPGIRIDKILVKEGSITLNRNNSFNNSGQTLITFSNATKNGVPFTYTTSPFTSGTSTETIDLAGVLFNLSAAPGIVNFQLRCHLNKSNQPVANDMIHIGMNLNISTIGWFEGYLGQQTFLPDEASVHVTVFNHTYVLGDLYFVDPQASITLVNSIGLPAKVTILKLRATNSSSLYSFDITDKLGPNGIISIPSPAITATVPVVKTVDYSNANTGNSMAPFFNVKPDMVRYQVKTELNPSKATTNFFSDTSSFYANLMVKLPLFGHFDHLTAQDTFDFDINKQKDVESVNFRTDIVNGLPLTAWMQIYFVDKNYHILDSLTGGNDIIIREAPVDPATHLPYPGQYGEVDTTFFFDTPRMDMLSNADHIIVRGIMSSSQNGTVNVKVRARQALKLNFSAEVKLRQNVGKK